MLRCSKGTRKNHKKCSKFVSRNRVINRTRRNVKPRLSIYKLKNPVHRKKMASFDYDWTLVSSEDGKSYPSSISDWKWLYPNIPQVIKEYHHKGYMIVIFTNQSKSWKHDQIKLAAKSLDIPIFIAVATDKRDYKPNPILFNSLFRDKQIDKISSFYVGDVIGRKSDYSDSDKVFAENIGIRVYSPEEMFRVE